MDCPEPFVWNEDRKGCVLSFPSEESEAPVVPVAPVKKVHHKHKPKPVPVVPKEEVKMDTDIETEAHAHDVAEVPTVSTVGMDPMADIQKLMPADGNATGMTAILAGLAVLGGITVKFGPTLLKSVHSIKMKRLQVEEKKAEKEQEGHQKCAVERSALEAKVADLEAKVSALAEKSEGFDLDDLDFGGLEDRIKKLEKALKAKSAAKKGGK
jgi:hypothetical protein